MEGDVHNTSCPGACRGLLAALPPRCAEIVGPAMPLTATETVHDGTL